jgi:hypothetical protein
LLALKASKLSCLRLNNGNRVVAEKQHGIAAPKADALHRAVFVLAIALHPQLRSVVHLTISPADWTYTFRHAMFSTTGKQSMPLHVMNLAQANQIRASL